MVALAKQRAIEILDLKTSGKKRSIESAFDLHLNQVQPKSGNRCARKSDKADDVKALGHSRAN